MIRTKIEELLNVSCPIKRIKIKKLKDPWVTNELLEFISDKEEALKTARRTGNEDDWHIGRYLRNLIKGLTRAAKRDYITKHLENNKKEPKPFWRTVLNSLIPQKSHNSTYLDN